MAITNKYLKSLESIFRNYVPKRLKKHNIITDKLKGKSGLEVGGPSSAFLRKGFIPLYHKIASLDGCNFSNETIWEGEIKEGPFFKYENRTGWQFIKDAVNLEGIENEKYDFILSCHSIEHIANPIKAIQEWKRVLKYDGWLLLIVPHKERTFDRNRDVTKLEHIINDFQISVNEDDTTHSEEVIEKHDIMMDQGISNKTELIERVKNNKKNRCLHHHAFNTNLVIELVDYCGFDISEVGHFSPFHIILLAKKTVIKTDNFKWKHQSNTIYTKSMFQSDKL